jgi:serine/threonine protein kinase
VAGSGGFAQVWLAMKKSTSDVYAIKAIRKASVRALKTEAAIDVENTILERHAWYKRPLRAQPRSLRSTLL